MSYQKNEVLRLIPVGPNYAWSLLGGRTDWTAFNHIAWIPESQAVWLQPSCALGSDGFSIESRRLQDVGQFGGKRVGHQFGERRVDITGSIDLSTLSRDEAISYESWVKEVVSQGAMVLAYRGKYRLLDRLDRIDWEWKDGSDFREANLRISFYGNDPYWYAEDVRTLTFSASTANSGVWSAPTQHWPLDRGGNNVVSPLIYIYSTVPLTPGYYIRIRQSRWTQTGPNVFAYIDTGAITVSLGQDLGSSAGGDGLLLDCVTGNLTRLTNPQESFKSWLDGGFLTMDGRTTRYAFDTDIPSPGVTIHMEYRQAWL